MSNCKLYETLTKAAATLDKEFQPKSYECNSECKWCNNCFYDCYMQLKDCKLQEFFGGWQKYVLIVIKKDYKVECNGGYVLQILHLINPMNVDDIVIFRIVKKDKSGIFKVRYLCSQGIKKQLCSCLTELNNYMDKKCEYVGRKITKKDFEI